MAESYLGFVKAVISSSEEKSSIGGFNDPAAVIVHIEAGPFRSSADVLRQVEFDQKRFHRRVRKFISSLPKGVAIVGGFARGLYLGDMRGVGDIDLACYVSKTEMENCDWNSSLQAVSRFLQYCGYKIVRVVDSYGGINTVHFLDIRCEPRASPYGLGIPRWNYFPIRPKWFWSPKKEIDVLASPNSELADFLKLFDISICQFAYLNGRLYATEAALTDLSQTRFRVLRDTDPERVRKYWRKGYSPIWDDLMEKVMRVGTFDEAFAEHIGQVRPTR